MVQRSKIAVNFPSHEYKFALQRVGFSTYIVIIEVCLKIYGYQMRNILFYNFSYQFGHYIKDSKKLEIEP